MRTRDESGPTTRLTVRPAPGSREILYVEDDTSLHEIVSAVLALEGFEVTAVSTAAEGLRQLATRRHGVLLTDFRLPDAAACWMISEARAHGLLWGVPVIVVTAERGYVETHGAPVLRKPIEFDRLLGVLRDALEHRERARSGTWTVSTGTDVHAISADTESTTREAS